MRNTRNSCQINWINYLDMSLYDCVQDSFICNDQNSVHTSTCIMVFSSFSLCRLIVRLSSSVIFITINKASTASSAAASSAKETSTTLLLFCVCIFLWCRTSNAEEDCCQKPACKCSPFESKGVFSNAGSLTVSSEVVSSFDKGSTVCC